MTFMRIFVLAVIAASLSSCVLDEKTFNAARPKLRQRPDIQARYRADCVRHLKYEHIETKRHIAGFMHTDLEGLPEKFCGRVMRGYLSGRMRFEDLDLVLRSQKFTPNMVAILRAG